MEPYAKLKERPLSRKSDVEAEIVTVFGNTRDLRGMELIIPYTRVVLKHEIHEFILTDEEGKRPESVVDRVGYICFAEITKGGAIMYGDSVIVKGNTLGTIVGFDTTHMPNHLNIVLQASNLASGFELGVNVGDGMLITDRI